MLPSNCLSCGCTDVSVSTSKHCPLPNLAAEGRLGNNSLKSRYLDFSIFFKIFMFVGGGMNGFNYSGTFIIELPKLLPTIGVPVSMNSGI